MKQLSIVDALESYEQISEHMSLELFAVALLASLVASFAAAGLYRVFYESRGTGSQVSRAFPLLGLAITTLFICIQVSIPLSLGLLGSLSIIRFRTPIKEPEEVGFILLVIAASVAAATYNFAFLVILYALALVSLMVARRLHLAAVFKRDGLLVLTLPATAATSMEALSEVLVKHLGRHSVQHVSHHAGATSLQVTFSRLRTDALRLQSELTSGLAAESVTVYLDRPGGIR